MDSIEGLCPAISIDQKTTSRNPRSTVGTVTEIYDYLRLLWARIGRPHCPECGEPIEGQSVEQITDRVMTLPEGTRFLVTAPVVRGRKGEYGKLLEQFRLEGYSRVRVDGEIRRLDEGEIKLDKKYKHDISVVVDRLVMKSDLRRAALGVDRGRRGAGRRRRRGRRGQGRARRPPSRGEVSTGRQGAPASSPATSPSGSPSASASPASTAAPRSPSWSRGSSPSTRRTAPASAATGSASSASSTPSWSCPTRRCRCPRARCSPGARATPATGSAWSRPSPTTNGVDVDAPWQELERLRARDLPLRHRLRAPQGQLHEPLRAPALLQRPLRGDRQQPRAPLRGDRLRRGARAGRGLHGRAALPRLQGRAAAAREPRGQGRRHLDQRLHRALGPRRARLDRGAGDDRDRAGDRPAAGARDHRAARLPGERRRRLPEPGALGADPVGRRGAADPARDPDRLQPGRRPLHPRRALDRAAPARQHEADPDARAPARPGQHRDRRRARRGHDALGRPPRGPGPGRRRARRPRRLRGDAEADRGRPGLAHRPVPGGAANDPAARASGASPAAGCWSRARASTT